MFARKLMAMMAVALATFGCDEKVDDKGEDEGEPASDASPRAPDAGPPQPGEWTPTSNTTMRILVAYTADTWANAAAFGYDPTALALARVELTNLVFSNSGVSHRAVLAGAIAISDDRSTIEFADECSGYPFGAECASRWLANQLLDTTSQLASQRSAAQADAVMLMLVTSEDEFAGYANGYPANSLSAQVAGAALVYTYDLTFPHELGHVLGCGHERSAAQETVQAFSFGYTVQALEAYTVMARPYDCEDAGGTTCTQVPWFSSPEAELHGMPLGDAAREFNACIVEHYGSEVASYYEMVSGAVPVAVTPDIATCPYPMGGAWDAGGELCVGDYVISSDVDLQALLSQCGTVRGDLTIADGVTTLSALQPLVAVEGHLTIDSVGLTSLAGLESLRYAEALVVSAPVASLAPLAGLRQVDALTVNGAAITDLSGLGGLVLANYVQVSHCDSLANLTGLTSLTSVPRTLTIEDCDALEELEGLESLAHAGVIRIIENDSLVTLAALSGLETVQGLVIEDNPSLTTIDAFDAVTEAGDSLYIRSNDALTDLAGLASLTRVDGDLMLDDLDALEQITGLEALRDVGRTVFIQNNADLTTLDGLAGLDTVESIFIFQNPNLNDCTLNLTSGSVSGAGNGAGCVL